MEKSLAESRKIGSPAMLVTSVGTRTTLVPPCKVISWPALGRQAIQTIVIARQNRKPPRRDFTLLIEPRSPRSSNLPASRFPRHSIHCHAMLRRLVQPMNALSIFRQVPPRRFSVEHTAQG